MEVQTEGERGVARTGPIVQAYMPSPSHEHKDHPWMTCRKRWIPFNLRLGTSFVLKYLSDSTFLAGSCTSMPVTSWPNNLSRSRCCYDTCDGRLHALSSSLISLSSCIASLQR